ncbi:MAG TPA: hypothetical protein VJ890_03785 [Vineibacter sp.]|nr:hypothetical protein [Vineibacter sp.]
MRRFPVVGSIALATILTLGLPAADGRAEKLPLPSVDYAADGNIMMHTGNVASTMRHAGGKIRIDAAPNGNATTVYFDLAAPTATIVTERHGQKIAMQVDASQVGGAIATAGIDAKRMGEDTVLGESCIIYEFEVTPGRPMQACVTQDGIGLRSYELGRMLWQATRVTRAPQDPALFKVPTDAVPLQVPRMR